VALMPAAVLARAVAPVSAHSWLASDADAGLARE